MKSRYKKRTNRNILRIRNGKVGVVDRLLRRIVFYDTKANNLYLRAEKAICIDNNILAGELIRNLGKIHDRLLDYANKVLPYVTPKLESIDIHEKQTKRYVVRMPPKVLNSMAWLEQIKTEQDIMSALDKKKAIEVEAKLITVDETEDTRH